MSKLTRAEGKGDAYLIERKRKVEVSSPTRTDTPVYDDNNQIVGKKRINQPSTYTFTKYKGAKEKEKVKKFVAKEDQGKGDYKAEKGTKVRSRKSLEKKTKKFADYKSNKIGQGDKKLARGSNKGSYETNKRDNKLTYEKREKALASGEEGKKFIASKESGLSKSEIRKRRRKVK